MQLRRQSNAEDAPEAANGDPGYDGATSERRIHLFAVAIAILAIIVRFWVSHQTHALGEDALITLRYAENIASGRGWVYNPGEHVLGTTTPLFTMLLALAAWLRLPAMPCGIAINILADGVTCYLIARLMSRPEIDCPIAGLFAALLYALSSTPISISISGMETALVACVGMAAIHAYVAGRTRSLCLFGALLFLLRIDGLLLFGMLLVGLAVRQRRVPWSDFGLFLLAVLPWVLFATFYFGSPVPASIVAKLTVYSRTAWTPGSFTDTFAFNREAFRNQFTLGWPQRIVTVLFLYGTLWIFRFSISDVGTHLGRMGTFRFWKFRSPKPVSAEPRPRINLLIPVLWLLLYYGTMLTSHVPAFPWYFLPPWPLFIVIAALGASTIVQFIRKSQRTLPASAPPGPGGYPYPVSGPAGTQIRDRKSAHLNALVAWQTVLGLFAAIGLLHVRAIVHDIAVAQEREDTLRRPLGIWLRDHVLPSERVLMEPIGYAGYYSRRRILDMVGLVSPEVLPYYHTPHALSGIVTGLLPEWLCLRRSERDLLHEQDASLPDTGYTLVRAFPSSSDPAFYLYHRRSKNAGNL